MSFFTPDTCGCCENECDCLVFRNSHEGTYSMIEFTGGIGSKGPYINIFEANELCGGPSVTIADYTLPGVPDFDLTLDYDALTCSDGALYINCMDYTRYPIYQVCDDGCGGPGGTVAQGMFLIGNALRGVDDCGSFYTPAALTTGISVLWACDEDNNPYYTLSVSQSYKIFEVVKAGGSCPYCPTSQPADGMDYTWETIFGNPYGPSYKATTSDGTGIYLIEYEFFAGRTVRAISTATTVTNLTTASIFAPFDPFNFLAGTVTLL